MKTSDVRKITTCAVMAAAALILGYVEHLVGFVSPVPGIKLGLANMVTIVAFYVLGGKYAWIISIVRILLSALLFGNAYSLMFSIAGGVLSLLVMSVLKRSEKFSATGISIAGAVSHNIGQIIVAAFMTGAAFILSYIPVLIVAGTVCGLAIGAAGSLIIKRLIKETGDIQNEQN